MNETPESILNPPSEKQIRFKYHCIALAPIPLGIGIIASAMSGQWDAFEGKAMLASLVSFIGSVIGSIGLDGGFKKGAGPKTWIGGFGSGMALFIGEIIIIFVVGFAIGLARI